MLMSSFPQSMNSYLIIVRYFAAPIVSSSNLDYHISGVTLCPYCVTTLSWQLEHNEHIIRCVYSPTCISFPQLEWFNGDIIMLFIISPGNENTSRQLFKSAFFPNVIRRFNRNENSIVTKDEIISPHRTRLLFKSMLSFILRSLYSWQAHLVSVYTSCL